jgi:hypothetical protein
MAPHDNLASGESMVSYQDAVYRTPCAFVLEIVARDPDDLQAVIAAAQADWRLLCDDGRAGFLGFNDRRRMLQVTADLALQPNRFLSRPARLSRAK